MRALPTAFATPTHTTTAATAIAPANIPAVAPCPTAPAFPPNVLLCCCGGVGGARLARGGVLLAVVDVPSLLCALCLPLLLQ